VFRPAALIFSTEKDEPYYLPCSGARHPGADQIVVTNSLRQFRKTASHPEVTLAYDACLLYDDLTLDELASRFLPVSAVSSFRRDRDRLRAVLRSAKEARVDGSVPLAALSPPGLFERHQSAKANLAIMAFEDLRQNEPEALRRYQTELLPFAQVLYQMEENGFKVDQKLAADLLKSPEALVASVRPLRSMLGCADKNGLVHTQYSPAGGKTGRVRVTGGFDSMAIPHGRARQAVVSRFTDGWIYAFDFNAIDYRSIVRAVKDEDFKKLYAGALDFHERTREILGEEVSGLDRKQLKNLSYVHFYGGSPSTCAESSRLPYEKVMKILRVMEEKLRPISDFREELFVQAREKNWIELPNGRRLPLNAGDHAGKVLGLYAQTYSSWVFAQAVVEVEQLLQSWVECFLDPMLPVMMFPVHDELVMDFPRESTKWALEIAGVMSSKGFAVKVKKGKNYDQATE
jgi:DNA polymerase family A